MVDLPVNVIGLDLSLTAPGMAAPGCKPETLRTDPKRGDQRFCDIRDWLVYNVEPRRGRRIDLAVIEDVPHAGDQAGSHLQRVHGVAREVLARYDVPFAYVNVTALKSFATGDGRADKSEVMAFVAEQTGQMPADDNQADAWVLKRMGEVYERMRYVMKIDPRARQALSSVEWPLRVGDPDWPQPYGAISARTLVRKKCGHKILALKNGDHWLHPFDVVRCENPPK